MSMEIIGEQSFIYEFFAKDVYKSAEELYEYGTWLCEEGRIIDGYTVFQVAAQKGHAEAAFQVATAMMGDNPFGSEELAVQYYSIAARQNHVGALCNLSNCYAFGCGVDKDDEEAFRIMEYAASLGDTLSVFNLAKMYVCGVGCQSDLDKAWELLRPLMELDYQPVKEYVAEMVAAGVFADDVADDRKPHESFWWANAFAAGLMNRNEDAWDVFDEFESFEYHEYTKIGNTWYELFTAANREEAYCHVVKEMDCLATEEADIEIQMCQMSDGSFGAVVTNDGKSSSRVMFRVKDDCIIEVCRVFDYIDYNNSPYNGAEYDY